MSMAENAPRQQLLRCPNKLHPCNDAFSALAMARRYGWRKGSRIVATILAMWPEWMEVGQYSGKLRFFDTKLHCDDEKSALCKVLA